MPYYYYYQALSPSDFDLDSYLDFSFSNSAVQYITLRSIAFAVLVIAATAVLGCMMPALAPAQRSESFQHRVPPAWTPENDEHYGFRAYMTDIALWSMMTDLQPHQQCAAIIMRLGGSAREFARTITTQDIMFGGVRNGLALDPVTY